MSISVGDLAQVNKRTSLALLYSFYMVAEQIAPAAGLVK